MSSGCSIKSTFCYGFLLLILLTPMAAGSQILYCPENPSIEVVGQDGELLEDICSGAERAISFLDRYTLTVKRTIRIEIVDSLINYHGYLAYGGYDRQKDLIRLMSLEAILESSPPPQMYGQPFDREHYLGAIGHEIAHAIFHQNSRQVEEQLTNAPQEYLAHATQLSILSPERRARILQENDVGPWEPGDSISVTYMGLKPTSFAVKSYLHLTQMSDPLPFIRILLNHNWFFVSVP